MNSYFRIAACVGFLGVALGAFGAHLLRDVFAKHDTAAIWQTAVLYHLVHAVVLLMLGARNPVPLLSWTLFFAGILVFSGSLYLLAFTGERWLGAITPIGGLCLLAGWLTLVLRP